MVITAAFTHLYIVIRCRTGNGFAALCAGAACFAAVYRPLVDSVSLCGDFNAYAYSAGLAGYCLGACFGAGGSFNNDAVGEIDKARDDINRLDGKENKDDQAR